LTGNFKFAVLTAHRKAYFSPSSPLLVDKEGSPNAIIKLGKEPKQRERALGSTGDRGCVVIFCICTFLRAQKCSVAQRQAGWLSEGISLDCAWPEVTRKHFPLGTGRAAFPPAAARGLSGRKSVVEFLDPSSAIKRNPAKTTPCRDGENIYLSGVY
jgi:hypothetical protein